MMRTQDQYSTQVDVTTLLLLVTASGVVLIQQDDVWKGHCPFHSDAEQSLIINPDKNHWHCPVCQASGSVVEWVMKVNGVSRSHALELLRNNTPLTQRSPDTLIQHSSVRHLDAPFAMANNDQEILQHVIQYYHESLKQSPQALNYLAARGLQHPQLVEYFQLGFSNRSLGYRLPEKNRVDGAALRGRLQRLGILKPSGHELFHGSLVVPIIENGLVKQIYGCKITEKLRPGTPRHTFLPNDSQGFFHVKAVQTCEELIVCPSIIDALTFWCAGYQNVTCLYGEATHAE